jgi:hypothetical protein
LPPGSLGHQEDLRKIGVAGKEDQFFAAQAGQAGHRAGDRVLRSDDDGRQRGVWRWHTYPAEHFGRLRGSGMAIEILTGVLLAALGGCLVYQKRRLGRVGQRVPGIVTGARERVTLGPESSEIHTWYLELAFRTLDGQDIRTEVYCGRRRHVQPVGAEVGVIYDPRRPSNAEMDNRGRRSAATGYAVVVVGLLVIVFGIVIVR